MSEKVTVAHLTQDAFEMYCATPSERSAIELLNLVAMNWLSAKGLTLAVVENIRLRFCKRLRLRCLLSVSIFCLRLKVRKTTPAYNDYLMARWKMTREPHLIEALHWRCLHSDLKPQVISSCRWMVSSISDQDPEFLEAWKKVCEEHNI